MMTLKNPSSFCNEYFDEPWTILIDNDFLNLQKVFGMTKSDFDKNTNLEEAKLQKESKFVLKQENSLQLSLLRSYLIIISYSLFSLIFQFRGRLTPGVLSWSRLINRKKN